EVVPVAVARKLLIKIVNELAFDARHATSYPPALLSSLVLTVLLACWLCVLLRSVRQRFELRQSRAYYSYSTTHCRTPSLRLSSTRYRPLPLLSSHLL